jgi:HEAT repeat protein
MSTRSEQAYEQAKRPIRALQAIRGARPFSRDELNLLLRTARDRSADFRLRARALTALWFSKQPSQQRAAVRVAAELLQDAHPTVRAYAVRALRELGALELYRQQVERLAHEDPDPLVHTVAAGLLAGTCPFRHAPHG